MISDKASYNYSKHYDVLVALVTHLGAKGSDESDAANPVVLAR